LGKKLLVELVFANDFELCVQIGCTTCGGFEFYENVLRCLSTSEESFSIERVSDPLYQEQIVDALSKLDPPLEIRQQIEAPTRYLLFHAEQRDTLERTMSTRLSNTWAGSILEKMFRHQARRFEYQERKQQEEVNRREEKARMRAEHQMVRKRLKAERDRVFKATGEIPRNGNRTAK